MKKLQLLCAVLTLVGLTYAGPAGAQPWLAAPRARPGTEISSSVSLLYQNDWDVQYVGQAENDWSSSCIDMLNRAKEFDGKLVNFMVTHYWADADWDGKVDYYCHKVRWGAGCPKMTKIAIDRFRFGLQWCMAKAVTMGLDIAITPHLDDGLEKGGWRNALVFDPLVKYNGFSYYDIMLRPVTQALNAVITKDTKVWFAMQGEMSATVVRHPQSWTYLVNKLKVDIVLGRQDELPVQNLKVGVSTNFNKLCACVLMDLVDPTEYLTKLPAAMKPIMYQFNTSAIVELYNTVDLIGISSYASLNSNFTLADLEDAIVQFDTELQVFGPDLKDLVNNKGKALVLSEYGVGGGISQNGNVPATTASEAAEFPFFGMFGSYNPSTDPWKTIEPETQQIEVRDWRRHFYTETSRWLKNGGGRRYRVDGVYLWAMASWDVQGIHYASRSDAGSYRDDVIASIVKNHNDYVHSAVSRRR